MNRKSARSWTGQQEGSVASADVEDTEIHYVTNLLEVVET